MDPSLFFSLRPLRALRESLSLANLKIIDDPADAVFDQRDIEIY